MNENLGIVRFCFVYVRTIQAFVTDLDILGSSSDSWRHSLDAGVGTPLLGSGVLHEGGDLLARGCAHCTKVPPTWSTPAPPAIVPDPRAMHAKAGKAATGDRVRYVR